MPIKSPESFLGLGLSSIRAEELKAKSWTPSKLKNASDKALDALGLDNIEKSSIQRPPIPLDTLFRVLHKSKRTCCICRTPGLPIIVHHIIEWHISKDHDEQNLVVLCLNHHGAAHSTNQLSQNLTPVMLRRHKTAWEEVVRTADARAVLNLSRVDGANWDYINLTRVFRLADTLHIRLNEIRGFTALRKLNIISESGYINESTFKQGENRISLYLIGLEQSNYLYFYTSSILEAIIERLGIVDISAVKSINDLRLLAEKGALVFIESAFYFRRESKKWAGRHQDRLGYTKIAGIKVKFSFDAWESTSSTAHSSRLSGRTVESLVGLVNGFVATADHSELQLTCLGIGSFFERIHQAQPKWRYDIFNMNEEQELTADNSSEDALFGNDEK